jgi:hypothetical protein
MHYLYIITTYIKIEKMITLIALPLLRIDNQGIASADNFYLLIALDRTF